MKTLSEFLGEMWVDDNKDLRKPVVSRHKIECPTCHAPAGSPCRELTPDGHQRLLRKGHIARRGSSSIKEDRNDPNHWDDKADYYHAAGMRDYAKNAEAKARRLRKKAARHQAKQRKQATKANTKHVIHHHVHVDKRSANKYKNIKRIRDGINLLFDKNKKTRRLEY